jgi:hypothetical protein
VARYSLRTRTTVTTNAAACYELRSTSTDKLFVQEIGIFLGAATASTYGLGRPQAIGVTPTSPVTVLAEDPGDPAGTATTAVAWGTGPTVPTQFLRAVALPAVIGSGIIWTFGGRGLAVPVSSSLVLWNLTANSAVTDLYVVVDE